MTNKSHLTTEADKPIHSFKPNVFAAFVYHFPLYLIVTLLLFGIPFIIVFFLAPFVQLGIPTGTLLTIYGSVALVSALARTTAPAIKFRSTTYILHSHHLEYNFRLVAIHTRSVEYDHIIDIVVKRSIADRLLGTGTIVLHTAEDTSKDLQLQFLNRSEAIKHQIQYLMRRSKTKRQFG